MKIKISDVNFITLVEEYGDEISNYPVDESQTISNAGDAVQYMYSGKKYEVITWNQCADEHDPESKTISELESMECTIVIECDLHLSSCDTDGFCNYCGEQ